MASSRKSSCDLIGSVAAALSGLVPPGSSILLGLSGGLDSVVLLHVLNCLGPKFGWRLSALHVHHGISPNADGWAEFCTNLCAEQDIPIRVERVDVSPLRDLGVEAAARQLRYAVLNAQPVDFVALAHHRDDQAETVLLQLLRGAGVRGASAMPMCKKRAGQSALLRPLLDVDRGVLSAYAQRHGLTWVDDESNADIAYPRNYLRHQVLPKVAEYFPAYRQTLARSAQHFAEASSLLDELAADDARQAIASDTLDIRLLKTFPSARGKNLLRYFILCRSAPLPDTSRLEEIYRQLCNVREGAQIRIVWQGWQICCYRNRAYVLRQSEASFGWEIAWGGERFLQLPGSLGQLEFQRVNGFGLNLRKLRQGAVVIRPRAGGERIRLHEGGPGKTLKNVFQELAVPPWVREEIPLLWCAGELVCIPGLVMAEHWRTEGNEEGVLPVWPGVAGLTARRMSL